MLFTLALGLFYLSRCLFNPFNTVWDVSDKIDGADFFFLNHVILAVMLSVNYCSQEQNVTVSVWMLVVITD